jgi:hypothetical protein
MADLIPQLKRTLPGVVQNAGKAASERVIDSTFEEFLANNAADSTRAFKEVPDAAPTYARDAVEWVEGRAEPRSATRRGDKQ